ncbi:MAG: GNAT family N-acetyltransferase [Myxococcota bacterium]
MPPQLQTPRTLLRLATANDADRVLAYWRANGHRYSPAIPQHLLTDTAEWVTRGEAAEEAFTAGTALKLYVFEHDERAVIGTVAFTDIQRAWWHRCALGYGVAGTHEGRGVMFEAVQAAIRFVFDELDLRRIDANHDVANVRSGALLARLGFEREGVSRQHMWIDGAFRDHVRTSLLNPSWRPTD